MASDAPRYELDDEATVAERRVHACLMLTTTTFRRARRGLRAVRESGRICEQVPSSAVPLL
jgi:hypothetical protein